MGSVNFFVFVIMVQLFWSFGATTFAYTLPDNQLQYVTIYTGHSTASTLQDVSIDVEENIESQVELPVIDAVTLIMFTGNLLVDLILNFLTAVPAMFILLIEGITLFIPIEATLLGTFKMLLWVTATVLYVIAIATTIANMRSSQGVN